jgi:hypothetical protein
MRGGDVTGGNGRRRSGLGLECFAGVNVVPNNLAGLFLQDGKDAVVFGEDAAHGFGGVDAEGLELAQGEEAEDMVDVGVGEDDSGNGSVAGRGAGMELGRGFDLLAEIRGCAEQIPTVAVGGDRYLCLRAGFAAQGTGAQATAVRTCAVPLRKSSSGGGAEDVNAHARD